MLLSLWTIGFSVASKQYLADRMESPFVTYLTIEIPRDIALNDEFERNITDSLSSNVIVKSFGKLDKDYVNQSLYPEGYNNEEYTLVDSKSHIRAQFNIEDARDIKKRVNILKLLDREFYQYKKTEVEQFRK